MARQIIGAFSAFWSQTSSAALKTKAHCRFGASWTIPLPHPTQRWDRLIERVPACRWKHRFLFLLLFFSFGIFFEKGDSASLNAILGTWPGISSSKWLLQTFGVISLKMTSAFTPVSESILFLTHGAEKNRYSSLMPEEHPESDVVSLLWAASAFAVAIPALNHNPSATSQETWNRMAPTCFRQQGALIHSAALFNYQFINKERVKESKTEWRQPEAQSRLIEQGWSLSFILSDGVGARELHFNKFSALYCAILKGIHNKGSWKTVHSLETLSGVTWI